MENRDNVSGFHDTFGLENSLAAIVRRRWRTDTVKQVEREWDLTNNEARGVVYATASRSTLNKIIRHKNGRLRLMIQIVGLMTGETIEQALSAEIEELRADAEKKRAASERLAIIERSLCRGALDRVGRGGRLVGVGRSSRSADARGADDTPMGF